MQRLKRLMYLLLVSAVSAFVIGLFVTTLIEVLGPSTSADGRVIERTSGTREVNRCYGGGRCYTTTYPTYSVLGERADGTAWIAVGEGPYDAMRGERGVIRVETSTVTGRVVGLIGNDVRDSTWSVGSSGMVWFSVGAFVIWIPLLIGYEWRRRTAFFDLGSFVVSDAPVAVIGIALGLVGLWFGAFAKTAGLDVATSSELYGDLLADPLTFIAEATEGTDHTEQLGLQVGEFFKAGQRSRLAFIDPSSLGAPPELPQGVVAVSLLRVPQFGTIASDRLQFWLVNRDDDTVEPVAAFDCPPGVTAFPSRLGVDRSIEGGFICFPEATEIDSVRVVTGSGAYTTINHVEYAPLRSD